VNECFVIQPFDQDKFDKRFNDVFKPAILDADLAPYRVDKDPGANDLVEAIKDGINRSAVFLADLTLDNPNVWYELGVALANGKPFCLICSDERISKYPFDISKLKIISYKTGSSSDFDKLKSQITERLKTVIVSDHKLQALAPSAAAIKDESGLASFEQVALSIIFEEHFDDGLTAYALKNQMERAGFTKAATALALARLQKKGFVSVDKRWDQNSDTNYVSVMATDEGVDWISQNHDKLLLTLKPKAHGQEAANEEITDEEIPF
jgi:hypothetical protein